jgi:hypothetical protein
MEWHDRGKTILECQSRQVRSLTKENRRCQPEHRASAVSDSFSHGGFEAIWRVSKLETLKLETGRPSRRPSLLHLVAGELIPEGD